MISTAITIFYIFSFTALYLIFLNIVATQYLQLNRKTIRELLLSHGLLLSVGSRSWCGEWTYGIKRIDDIQCYFATANKIKNLITRLQRSEISSERLILSLTKNGYY